METPYQDLNTESPSLSQSLVLLKISDSPDPICDSMRSDVSVDQPATFKDGDPSSGHRSDHVLLKLLPVVAESRTANLLRCRLTKKSCAGLASLLSSESSHLRNLYLSQNKLRDSGVKLLCAGLNNPLCKLESLRLRGCKVTVKGCAALASALKSNPSQLKELHLSKNKIGDSGVKLICAVLENPLCKLEALWLWDCKVTDEGCAVLALALKSNPSHLRELNLRENPEIKSGREQLLALKHDEHYRLDELIL
ncbi:hypothetical protein MHYP_G00307430 [Metynnis hypsauchen]